MDEEFDEEELTQPPASVDEQNNDSVILISRPEMSPGSTIDENIIALEWVFFVCAKDYDKELSSDLCANNDGCHGSCYILIIPFELCRPSRLTLFPL